jgi:hypothetical protein
MVDALTFEVETTLQASVARNTSVSSYQQRVKNNCSAPTINKQKQDSCLENNKITV